MTIKKIFRLESVLLVIPADESFFESPGDSDEGFLTAPDDGAVEGTSGSVHVCFPSTKKPLLCARNKWALGFSM